MDICELREKRKEAFKRKNYAELSELNKQIFAIREEARKQKEHENMLKSFHRFHEKVEEKLKGEQDAIKER